jgi:hypothetical protein
MAVGVPGHGPAGEEARRDRSRDRYAKTADGVHIAYQVVGSGPVDMVVVMGVVVMGRVTNVEVLWDEPGSPAF